MARKIMDDAPETGKMNYDNARKHAYHTALLEDGKLKMDIDRFEIDAPPGTTVNFFGRTGSRDEKKNQNQGNS